MNKITTYCLSLFLLLSLNFSGYSQENEFSNFYFSESQPSGVSEQNQFPEELCGKFVRLENERVKFHITPDSIYCSYPVIMSLTVAEIKSSGKYEIRGEEIFGVHEKKGLPVKVFNDTAVFVHFQEETFFRASEDQVLKKVDGVYYLNYRSENGLWTTLALRQFGNMICMYSMDHMQVMEQVMDFKKVKKTKQDGMPTLIASPSQQEMLSFFNSKGFTDREKYIRKNED